MKSNKLHFLIIALFALFWLILISWGFLKTAGKLTPGKTVVSKPQQGQSQARNEAAPKQKAPQEAPQLTQNQPAETPKPAQRQQPPPATVTVKSISDKAGAPKALIDKAKELLGIASAPKEETKLPETATPLSNEPSPVLVRAFVVVPKDFQDQLPVMGSVKAKKEIPFKFEVNGVIKKIYFREGEKVKKGDTVVELDPKDMEYRVNYARSKFKSTEAAAQSEQKKLEVHQKLYEAGAIIKSKLEEVQLEADSAKFQIETARAELELAENEYKKIVLLAPCDGVMGPRDAEEGEFVTPQDRVLTLYEIKEVYVEVGIVERDIEKVKIGQHAKAYVDAYPSTTFEATVENIFPVIEGKSRTLTAKLKVQNPDSLLLPGMFSRADILIIQIPNAIIVPTTCLIKAGKDVVLAPVIPPQTIKKTEDEAEVGIVQLRQVTVGYSTSDYAQIKDGLAAQDLVVLEAQGELKDNAKVKIMGREELTF